MKCYLKKKKKKKKEKKKKRKENSWYNETYRKILMTAQFGDEFK